MLKKGLFIEPLKTRVAAFINLRSDEQNLDITVDANDIRWITTCRKRFEQF